MFFVNRKGMTEAEKQKKSPTGLANSALVTKKAEPKLCFFVIFCCDSPEENRHITAIIWSRTR